MTIGFSVGFHANGLDIFYNGNLFGHLTLKGDFVVLNLDDAYDNISSVLFHIDSNSKSFK